MAKKDVCEACVKILKRVCDNTGDVNLCRLALMYEDGREAQVLKELKKKYNNDWFRNEVRKAKEQLLKEGEITREEAGTL